MTENVSLTQTTKKSFNWSDIDVGNYLCDDSQNFFAKKHSNHEKKPSVNDKDFEKALAALTIEAENKENVNNRNAIFLKKDKMISPKPQALQLKDENQKFETTNDSVLSLVADERFSHASSKVSSNIVLEWSTKNVHLNGAGAAVTAPQAFKYQKIYDDKKLEILRRNEVEQRKKREFHSRPLPNFYTKKIQLQRQKIHKITLPFTPDVLKHSIEMEEKKKKKLELLRKEIEPTIQLLAPRAPNVLKKAPFMPKIRNSSVPVPAVPFNLRLEQRLQERKKFDAALKKAREEREKQLKIKAAEREKQEMEELKKLRLKLSFKARPNPFKVWKA